MNAQKLIDILTVVVEHDPKTPLAASDERLWVAPLDELSNETEGKLAKLGVHLDHQQGWFVWL